MKLKGVMTIDLTGADGKTERHVEENMLTEAVNDVFSLNPFGVHFTAGEAVDSVAWYKEMLPICPNLLGGILLFPKALKEDAAAIYPPGDNLPVAYASNDVNSTANMQRGSLNLSESKALDKGYRFVWEFTPSQGNGAISAAALTSKWGGANAFGSTVETGTTFKLMKKTGLGQLPVETVEKLFNAVEYDFEKETLVSITYKDHSVVITKMRVPSLTLGLNEQLDDTTITVLEEQAVDCGDFVWEASYAVCADFFDGKDGYWYGFSTAGNEEGDAVLYWIRIKKEDYSATEGSWTLSNATLCPVGSRLSSGTMPRRKLLSVFRKGYLYVMGNSLDCIYKINAANQTDVTKIPLGFTSEWKTMGATSQSETKMICVNDIIMAWDFYISLDDKPVQITGTQRIKEPGSPFFQYKNYMVQWGAGYGSAYRNIFLLSPYLASVNNLSETLTKTAEMTMKITYEVTEEKEGDATATGDTSGSGAGETTV